MQSGVLEACSSRALPDFNTISAILLPPKHKSNKMLGKASKGLVVLLVYSQTTHFWANTGELSFFSEGLFLGLGPFTSCTALC